MVLLGAFSRKVASRGSATGALHSQVFKTVLLHQGQIIQHLLSSVQGGRQWHNLKSAHHTTARFTNMQFTIGSKGLQSSHELPKSQQQLTQLWPAQFQRHHSVACSARGSKQTTEYKQWRQMSNRFFAARQIVHAIHVPASRWHDRGQSKHSTVPQAAIATAYAQDASTEPMQPGEVLFDDLWVNCVGVTGVVVQGPQLLQFRSTNTQKAILVLALYHRQTGDHRIDRPRSVLVEAWGDHALALCQQIQMGNAYQILGHLSLDLRKDQTTSGHGPAVCIVADTWAPVAERTIPAGCQPHQYRGEFSTVFHGRWQAISASPAAPMPATPLPVGATTPTQLQPTSSEPPFAEPVDKRRKRQPTTGLAARELLLQGQPPAQIAATLQTTPQRILERLVESAVSEGPSSEVWHPLLKHYGLTSGQIDPVAVWDGIDRATAMNPGPPTKSGEQRLRPIREYLLAEPSNIGQQLQQQEAQSGGPDATYSQLRVLVNLKRVGGHPSQHM